MYPSMMAPDVKKRWDMKNLEWENQKEKYRLIKRMARAQFLLENKDLPLARDLAKTAYGKELLLEAAQSEFMNIKGWSREEMNRGAGLYASGNTGNIGEMIKNKENRIAGSGHSNVSKKGRYWTVIPKPEACAKCQALAGINFMDKPKRPHPNCKCEIKEHNISVFIEGTLEGFDAMENHKFSCGQVVNVAIRNHGFSVAGGVEVFVNGSDYRSTGWLPGGMSQEFRFSQFAEVPVPWTVKLRATGADNCYYRYSLRG